MTEGLDIYALCVVAGMVVATGACVAVAPTKKTKRDEIEERLLVLLEKQEMRLEKQAALVKGLNEEEVV